MGALAIAIATLALLTDFARGRARSVNPEHRYRQLLYRKYEVQNPKGGVNKETIFRSVDRIR